MKRIVFSLLAIVMLAGGGLQAQQRPVKSKVVFEADSLPSQLLRFLNGNMKAEDKLAANAQVVQQFEGAYNAMTRDRREKWLRCTIMLARPSWRPSPTMST